MKKLKYTCELLSEIIINQKSSTEGSQKTLDFIPGSNFLGIVASQLYNHLSKEQAWVLFHSGKCIFGDAHMMEDNKRSIKVPASLYYPKLSNDGKDIYVYHNIEDHRKLLHKQLKQQRNGFYCVCGDSLKRISETRNFSLKSAYDRERRKSADSKMFGYEALPKGLKFAFEVILQDEATELETLVNQSLVGIRHIGRSRSAQYGLVKIKQTDYEEITQMTSHKDYLIVYAESRLIFLDSQTLLPTFQPEVEQILGKGVKGEIDWSRSQIRTFQYAPWNYKRQCYDTDRCGIEKGSVIYIKTDYQPSTNNQYVGFYKNEGFGKILFNPTFLESQKGQNGKWNMYLAKDEQTPSLCNLKNNSHNSLLIKYLDLQKEKIQEENNIYVLVNDFIRNNGNNFRGNTFASQWGNIRTIAMNHNENKELKNEIKDYIEKGVAAEKWKRGRKEALLEFLNTHQNSINLQKLIINLASEMAKKCNSNE